MHIHVRGAALLVVGAFFDFIGLCYSVAAGLNEGTRMKGKHLFTAAIGVGIAGAPAWAASVVFDFRTNQLPSAASSFDFTDPGSAIKVTASGYDSGVAAAVVRSNVGLGVYTPTAFDPFPSIFQVDGVGGNESIKFEFSRSVQLNSLTFSLVDSDDNVVVTVLDTNGVAYNNLLDPNAGSDSTLTLNLAGLSNRTGLRFSLRSADPTDDFAIAGLSANYFNAPSSGGVAAAAPLPSSAWAGLGLMAMAVAAPKLKKHMKGA
jgi:hypothetical protein